MSMSIPYEATGRTNQKARTRAALLAATRKLLTEGITPTVEQAADRAAISRTTAYRYFRNQRTLLVATYPSLDESSSLLGDAAPNDVEERLAIAAERFTAQILQYEPELRTQLRLSLEVGGTPMEALPLRQGRAIAWIEEVLSPLKERLPKRDLCRLVLALRATMGIEALVWLTDVAGASRKEAAAIMRWSAQALLRSALADANEPRGVAVSSAASDVRSDKSGSA